MGAIQASGIVSGLDTDSIVNTLVASAKTPIYALSEKKHKLEIEQSVYSDINSDITSMRSAIFNLRLESTFNSKTVNNTNSTVLNASVTSEAAVGSHTIQVLQTAANASMSSTFAKSILTSSGAGIYSVAGANTLYDQLSGQNTITVKDNGTYAIATNNFTASDNSVFQKYTSTGTIADAATDGTLTIAADTSITYNLTVNGESVSVDLNLSAGSTTVQELMFSIGWDINTQINNTMGTSGIEYITMKAEFDGSDWSSAFYNVSGESISLDSVSGAYASDMGLDGTISKTNTKVIRNDSVAADLTSLQTQLETTTTSSIYGVAMTFDTIEEGTFVVTQSTEMSIQGESSSRINGVASTIDSSVSRTDALSATSLASSASGLNGTFSINGVSITISDAENKSINDIMAIVNSSGAGVTMSYDSTSERFYIVNNASGATTITVDAGTSNFFDTFGLSSSNGATMTLGSTAGSIDTIANIIDAGFTFAPTSGIITINDVPIYVDVDNDSIETLITKINSSAAGVTLSYDSVNGKFVVESSTTGYIRFGNAETADTSNMLVIMGLTYTNEVCLELGDPGQNAIVKVDGQTYQRETNEISDILEGVTFTTYDVGTSVIDIKVDTDKSVEALATFIKCYNELLNKISYSELDSDEKSEALTWLTDDDKESMTSDEITAHETAYDEMYYQDVINRSSELRQLKKDLRANIMSDVVNGTSTFKNLSEIGFTIAGSGSDADITLTQKGYLLTESTDLEEIKAAITANSTIMDNLENNAEEVYNFFGNYEETTDSDGNTVTVNSSWARRYEKMLTGYQDIEGAIGVKVRSDSSYAKQISIIDSQITAKNLRVQSYLTRLWSSFTNMETKLATIQSQADYISQISASTSS